MKKLAVIIATTLTLLFITGCNLWGNHANGSPPTHPPHQVENGPAPASHSKVIWRKKAYFVFYNPKKGLKVGKKLGTGKLFGDDMDVYSVKGHSPDSIIAVKYGYGKNGFVFAKPQQGS